MPSTLSSLPTQPICLSCVFRSWLNETLTTSRYPPYTPFRSKKTSTKKPSTINVRLLKDVVGYGRKGAIVPVAPGLFRNHWQPRKRAEYLSTLQGIKPRDVTAERDFSFGLEGEAKKEEEEEAPMTPVLGQGARGSGIAAAKTKLIAPERATEILEATIPSQIRFYRIPIADPKPLPSSTDEQRRDVSLAAAALAAASAPTASRSEPETIFGSVSTADMAEAIKALLARDEESARVVIAAEDIRIVGDGGVSGAVEGDRLKAIGEFEVELRVKGGEVVRRVVCVKPQEGI